MATVSESTRTDQMEQAEPGASPIVGLDLDRKVHRPPHRRAAGDAVFEVEGLNVYYGDFRAVQGATFTVYKHEITAMIGPSGCGKTTVLRCFNRMNDLIPSARVEGRLDFQNVAHLRRSGRSRGGASAHRHGVPEAPTRSPSRSTTTSPSAPGSRGYPRRRATLTTSWSGR